MNLPCLSTLATNLSLGLAQTTGFRFHTCGYSESDSLGGDMYKTVLR